MQRIIYNFLQITNIILICALSACTLTNKSQRTSTNQVEIALMLPLSGAHAEIGKKLEKVIKAGFENRGAVRVNIQAYDTEPGELSKSLNKALSRNSKIIIGPLFSNDSKVVADRIKNSDCVMLSLSNDPRLIGDNIFVYGHAPKRQSQRIIEYYLSQGDNNFVILLPTGPYFFNLNKDIQARLVAGNGTHVRSEFYSSDPESIDSAVKNAAMAIDRLNEDDQNLKKPILLVYDDPKNLKNLIKAMDTYNLDKKAEIVSDWRINIPAANHLTYSFTGTASMANSELLSRLQGFVDSEYPSPIDFIAYDLGEVIMKSLNSGYNKTQFITNLRNDSGFNGISGKVKFEGSIAVRPYDIIRHNEKGYEVIEESK